MVVDYLLLIYVIEVLRSSNSTKLDHQAEILNVTPMDWAAPSWTRSTFSHDQVIHVDKAKVRAYSGSVLCVRKMSFYKEAIA